MAKQKKKNTQLSSLQKAFGIAAKFPSLQPSEFRDILVHFKARNVERRKELGYQEDPTIPPRQDVSNIKRWEQLRHATNSQDMCAIARDFVLESWYEKKRVFICSSELIDYVMQKFPAKYLSQQLDLSFYQICHVPIYLEFPDGFTVPEQVVIDGALAPSRVIQGAFFGQCQFQNDILCGGRLCCATIGVQVSKDKQLLTIHRSPEISVSEYFEQADDDIYQRTVFSLLVYLNFVYGKEDGIGSVLFPQNRKGSAECFDVKPIPFLDSIPNKHDPTSIVVAGLCTSLGYLSRHNMSAKLRNVRDTLSADISYSFKELDEGNQENAGLFLKRKTCDMILCWEQYRTIYQYDGNTMETLKDKYLEEIGLWGFKQKILRYFPQDTIVLHQSDSNRISLMSVCDIVDSDGMPSVGIMVSVLADDDLSMAVFPANSVVRGIKGTKDTVDLTVDSLCVLYHILTVYAEKAIKKMVKDVLTAGNPDSTNLVVVPPQPEITHVIAEPKPDPEPLSYHIGHIIENSPFELFAVTAKTVKRQRQEEKKIKMGWKVVPHVRRPHPHRYWVGHGADKHLEVRWIERVQIHKDQTAEKSTLHQVKA